MARCVYCGQLILLGGVRQVEGAFCNERCLERFHNVVAYPEFCPGCLAGTKPESSGGTFTFNGIGTKLYGSKEKCPVCGSVIQTLWICVIYVPIIPLGRFRVKYFSPSRFISRKVLAA